MLARYKLAKTRLRHRLPIAIGDVSVEPACDRLYISGDRVSSDHPLMEWAIAQAKLHISLQPPDLFPTSLFKSIHFLRPYSQHERQKITRLGIQIVQNLTVQRSSCPHHFKGGMADFLDDSGLVSDYNMGEYERNLIFNMQEVDFKMP
jgi:hypothetical protein